MKKSIFYYVVVLIAVLSLSACSTMSNGTMDAGAMETKMTKAELDKRLAEIEKRESAAATMEARTTEERAKMDMQAKGVTPELTSAELLLPQNAQAGECYARVFVPNTYKTVSEQVLKHAASERIEIFPPQYKTVEEQKLAKEASERLEVVPAKYEWVAEKVMVTPPSYKLVEVPATYETVSEKILVREAHMEWKKGRGPIQKIDEATGEIMCLVEEPALYKTVSKIVLKTPVSVTKVEIPATYKNVKRHVMKTPPTTRVVTIPAEYQTVRVTKLVQPATEKRVQIPAQYQTVTKKVKVSDGHMEWFSILCETNMTQAKVSGIQTALKRIGHDPGPIDGIIGAQTMRAVNSFQKEKGLVVSSYLTMNTLKELGIAAK